MISQREDQNQDENTSSVLYIWHQLFKTIQNYYDDCPMLQIHLRQRQIFDIMGQVATKICGSEGPLKMLMKEYGDDVSKFIVIEKVKNYLDQKIEEMKRIVDSESEKIKGQTFGEIQMREKELENEFLERKEELNKKVPGGISSLEKLKGEPIEEMLGFNDFKNRFFQLKQKVESRFLEEKTDIYREIDRKALLEKEKLDQQRPKIPLYDNLSENQQKMVFREGEKIFKEEIQEHEGLMKKQLDDTLNLERFIQIFKSIAPNNSIVGLVEGFKVKIQAITKILRGGGSLGDIARDIF